MAPTKRIIRKALVEVLQSDEATFEERIKTARMLTKLTIHGQRPTRSLDALDYTPRGVHNSTSTTRFSGIMSLTNPI